MFRAGRSVFSTQAQLSDNMRVLFYDHGSGSLGIQYLMAVLQQHGHEPLLHFDCSLSKDYLVKDLRIQKWLSFSAPEIVADILAQQPDMVCFSLTTHFFKQSLELIREVKIQAPDMCVTCGGIHATLVPERVLGHKEVDFVVQGEGEISFLALVGAIQNHGVAKTKALPREALPGVWSLHDGVLQDRGLSPLVPDLDQLPFPEKRLHRRWNPQMTAVYTTLANRGCPYGCTYCNSVTVRRMYDACGLKYCRAQSVSRTIDEIKQAKQLFSPNYVEFYDDVFGADMEWLREFAERFPKEVGLPFGIETNPTVINEARVELLAKAGCATMEMGFQSANALQRANVLNRRETADGVRNLIQAAANRKIFTELDFIVGLPGEQPEHIEEMLEYIRRARPRLVNLSFLQFFPKTRIIDLAIASGQIDAEEIPHIEDGDNLLALRLPPESRGAVDYGLLPLQVSLATAWPASISRCLTYLTRLPGIRRVVSATAFPVLYLYRLSRAARGSKCYYLRWQVKRGLFSLWAVAKRRLRGRAFEEPPSSLHGRRPGR